MSENTDILLFKIIELLETLPARIALEHEKMMDNHVIKHADTVLKEIEELFSKIDNHSEDNERVE